MSWLTGLWLTLQDAFLLATKALPSDEQRLAAFKIRSPKFYARVQKAMLNGFVFYCKNHFGGDFTKTYGSIQADKEVANYVTLETGDLPVAEQQLFISLTTAEYKK